MGFLLSDRNVVDYLKEKGFCQPQEQPIEIRVKIYKNFNLLVTFDGERHLLVKQEPSDGEGEFAREWCFHQWLAKYPELADLRGQVSEALDYDRDNAILVFNYLDEYVDLEKFYQQENIFPTAIAASVGTNLAAIHRSTLNKQEYREFLIQNRQEIARPLQLTQGLEEIKPEIFGEVTRENLQFFELYQRHEDFHEASVQLQDVSLRCCLVHNDLKLANILVNKQWEKLSSQPTTDNTSTKASGEDSITRLIDWELFTWGEPALDVGRVIGSYLKIWLDGLILSTDIDLATALSLTATPLNLIQPSLAALAKAYFSCFPEIIEQRPEFLKYVVQFAGIALMKEIGLDIYYHEPFTNKSICMLQVAKKLLCTPEKAMLTVFGTSASELIDRSQLVA
jgi:hypothetical protein